MMIRVEVYDKRLRTRLANLQKKLDGGSRKATMDVAQIVKFRAKYIAPKNTTKTAQFIKSWATKDSKGVKEWTVGFMNGGFGSGNPHPEKTWGGVEFSLPLWMHTSNRARGVNWKSGGRPRFLYEAAETTRLEYRRMIETMIREST
jgi:hypothetical protein